MRRCSILITVLAAACGGGTPPAPAPGGTSPVVESITGRERIGWNQPADNPAQLATFQFAIYIDGARSELRGVACPPIAETGGFNCSAPLPSMTNGIHTLELAAFVQNGASVLESPRSPGLRVSVTASTAPVDAAQAFGGTERLADGATLRVEKLADGLNAPVDAAFAADGTLFLAERRGGISVFANDRPEPFAALRWPDGAEDDTPQILSIALDPNYLRTRFVFVVEATPAAGGAALQMVRYREVRGRLGERAVLFQVPSPVPPAAASSAVRFGPDTKIYLATGAFGGGGTLARLNPDGSMPRDQAGSVPDIATGVETVRGLDWDPRSNVVWIADEGDTDAHLSGLSLTPAPVRAAVRVRKRIAGGTGSLGFYRSDALPSMRGDTLLASPEGYILRLRIDPDDPTRIEWVEKMFDRAAGPVRVVAVSPDGAIYFCTDSVLARLVPVQ
jgi:glucose/arabinose dehydrogenase